MSHSLGVGGQVDSSDVICSFCGFFRIFATLFPKATELYKI